MTEIEPARFICKIEKALELTNQFYMPESSYLVGIKLSIGYLGYDGDKAEKILPSINTNELTGKSKWVIKQWQLQHLASDSKKANEFTNILNKMETEEEVRAWVKQEPWVTGERKEANHHFDQVLIGLYTSKFSYMFINNSEDESAVLVKKFYGE